MGTSPGARVVVQRHDLGLEQLEQAVGLDLDATMTRPSIDSADEIAQPLAPSSPSASASVPDRKHSAHHPSRTEQCSAPFITAFMPLVPDASMGRTGVFSQMSAPWTRARARAMS